MLYAITDRTRITFEEPVRELVADVRREPMATAWQRCLHFELKVTPNVRIHRFRDYLGNLVHHFNIPHAVEEIDMKAEWLVESNEPELEVGDWDELPETIESFNAHEMLFASPLVQPHSQGRPLKGPPEAWVLAAGREFSHGAEPCHDLAAFFRSSGLPVRLACGFVLGNGKPRRHRWCEICLPRCGWRGFDPSTGGWVSEGYVTLAVGRDGGDLRELRHFYQGFTQPEVHSELEAEKVS